VGYVSLTIHSSLDAALAYASNAEGSILTVIDIALGKVITEIAVGVGETGPHVLTYVPGVNLGDPPQPVRTRESCRLRRRRGRQVRRCRQPLTCSQGSPTLVWPPPVTAIQPTAQVLPSPRPLPAAAGLYASPPVYCRPGPKTWMWP